MAPAAARSSLTPSAGFCPTFADIFEKAHHLIAGGQAIRSKVCRVRSARALALAEHLLTEVRQGVVLLGRPLCHVRLNAL